MATRSPLKYFLLSAFLLIGISLAAQQKLTLSDAVLKAGKELAPERLRGIQWIEDSDTYCYVKDDMLMIGQLGRLIDLPLISKAELNAQMPKEDSLRGFPPITWDDADRFHFMHSNAIWSYSSKEKKLSKKVEVPENAENHDIHEVTGNVAFTIGNDLHVAMAGNGKMVQVTSDGGDGIVNGKSVHREEYGITKGTFWDKAGEKLAFYRMDESMVTTYALEDLSTKPSTFKQVRYPMAGQKSHHVTVGIHDLKKGSTTFLRTGGPLDQYLTNISWDPTGTIVHVVHLDRATENLKVVSYDAITGNALGTLIEEHDDKYLEPQHPIEHIPGRTDRFIWRSQRDGWPHIYLYDKEGKPIRQLTKGTWEVKDVLGFDEKGELMIVSGTLPIDPKDPKGALETHLYRISTSNGKATRLTNDPGTHYGQLSSSGRYIIDQFSSLDVANRIQLIDVRTGKVIKTLLDAREPLADRAIGTIELLTIEGEEGDRLNARLIKPSGFDPARKYPVLIYTYNGPHVQLIANARLSNAALWMFEAAERGYLIWTVDGHGSAYRGRDFEQVVHRRLGEVEVRDQMRGVDHLRTLPFVDTTRMAVHGWSFGGHMTTAMLTRHPGVFKVGVAGGPVMDWSMYEVMYTERYMDTPEENPDGYASTALPPLAERLTEDLLIITGGQDNVVLPQHGLTFIKNCIDSNVQVDFFEYPGHMHNVMGKDRLHLMEKVMDYIDRRIEP